MASTRRIFALLILVFIATRPLPTAEAADSALGPALGPATPLSASEAELVAGAQARFGELGLDSLRGVVVSFHEDVAQCNGNLGLSTVEDDSPRLRICWSSDDPGVRRILQEQALVHELAHVWLDENVDETTREEFVEITGSGSWRLQGTAWGERGIERAAELLTWAVLDPPVLFVDTETVACELWAEGYTVLTRQPAPDTVTNCR